MADPLDELTSAGVAIWLDDLSRARLATGSLADLVRDCHVVGVTSNPTIFQKAQASWAALAETLEHKLAAATRGGAEGEGPT